MSVPEMKATVWSSTFVPSQSPFPDFGQQGYSVAWVDTAEGRMQVLVDGVRPGIGANGRLVAINLGDETVEVFQTDPS